MDAEEQRVLGVLLEKQVTVPASYPMTPAAVRTGCNQSSSREPVVDYDEPLVEAVLKRLKEKGLTRVVWADTGRRTLKHHQLLDEVLDYSAAERALLTVLLLRGPQSAGELRTRTDRLYPFDDRGQVEQHLREMASRPEPWVRELPRPSGRQDVRWVHLLGDPAAAAPETASAAPTVDRDTVIAGGAEARDAKVRASYDAIAAAYAEALTGELPALPFERWLLDRVAADADGGPVVEVGCGPGHVTAHLAEAGADATGLDLSPGMVEQARSRYPDGVYETGDLRRLMRPTSAPGWSAVLAWYSLIHSAASELPDAIGALTRPLLPGGLLVLAMHTGDAVRHLDAWFDVPVDLDFVLHDRAQVVALVEAAGLVDVEWYVRGPVASRGETTQRLYVVARRPPA
ncbi:DUF480 domain-containing protein [Nocardioides sp. YIM 123512]|uniref:DUF480 domain-containing protein n=1 Tax=Nocardioides flavescens TaxID=2691959 RepID=A0A6L7ESX7_9ACTN|nr:DUF480 domain-containing protein [Nocardioides flavescens]MXG88676.1 DUF480 domain-containing protein [Nocardioides flavescens]